MLREAEVGVVEAETEDIAKRVAQLQRAGVRENLQPLRKAGAGAADFGCKGGAGSGQRCVGWEGGGDQERGMWDVSQCVRVAPSSAAAGGAHPQRRAAAHVA